MAQEFVCISSGDAIHSGSLIKTVPSRLLILRVKRLQIFIFIPVPHSELGSLWDRSPMQIKWIEDPESALDKEIDSLTLVFNHTGFSQTSFRACRMHEKQVRSVGFLKSHILSEEVTNCSFHTIRSVKRPNRGRLRSLCSGKERWVLQGLAGKQCSEGTLNLKRANKMQVVFTLMLFIFFTDLLCGKTAKTTLLEL